MRCRRSIPYPCIQYPTKKWNHKPLPGAAGRQPARSNRQATCPVQQAGNLPSQASVVHTPGARHRYRRAHEAVSGPASRRRRPPRLVRSEEPGGGARSGQLAADLSDASAGSRAYPPRLVPSAPSGWRPGSGSIDGADHFKSSRAKTQFFGIIRWPV